MGAHGLCPGDHAGDGRPGRGGGRSSGPGAQRRAAAARSGRPRAATAAARPARSRRQPARRRAGRPRAWPRAEMAAVLTTGDPLGGSATAPPPRPRSRPPRRPPRPRSSRPCRSRPRRRRSPPPRRRRSPTWRGSPCATPTATPTTRHARALGGAGPARPRDGAGAQPGHDRRQLPAARGGHADSWYSIYPTPSTWSRSARAAHTSRRWRSTSTRRARRGRRQALGAAGRRALQGAGPHGRHRADGAGHRALRRDGHDAAPAARQGPPQGALRRRGREQGQRAGAGRARGEDQDDELEFGFNHPPHEIRPARRSRAACRCARPSRSGSAARPSTASRSSR